MPRTPRIPKAVNFGLGFKVPVQWRGKLPGMDGKYQPATAGRGGQCIEMSEEPSRAVMLETYAHEVLHAAIDFQLYVLRELVEPMRAKGGK